MNNKEAAQIIRTAVLKEEGKSEYSDQDIKIALEIAAELLDSHPEHKIISREEYKKLARVGILNTSVRAYNRGNSDYSQHVIQPWSIWIDWNLNPWDADIVKRVLRTKQGESRLLDYEKIIHICEERIRQINCEHEQE
ncbi:MAG: hypothetical protein J5658_08840 [Prevotella sp.]|jgi:hypothetical protein|nr:hypothetical protein [Prevotella sp.]